MAVIPTHCHPSKSKVNFNKKGSDFGMLQGYRCVAWAEGWWQRFPQSLLLKQVLRWSLFSL